MKNEPTLYKGPKRRRVILRQFNMDNEDFRKLFYIFRLTICPTMSEKAFEAYYNTPGIEYIDVTFSYTANGEISGFSAAAFYDRTVGGSQVIIARSATGVQEQYRGGAFDKLSTFLKYMRYKIRHPRRNVVLTIFASNPNVYSMVCKYNTQVYPRYDQAVPDWVLILKNDILASNKLQRRERQPFVVRINFEVEKSAAMRQQAFESTNPHVRFFVAQTGLQPCHSLLVIVPVTFYNIRWSLWLIARHGILKKAMAPIGYLRTKATICKKRLHCWLNQTPTTGYANEEIV